MLQMLESKAKKPVRISIQVITRWGTVESEKVFRGLKTMDTGIINCMRVYYNFTKKHGALKGKSPAEAFKIQVEGVNKWKTIIQNASLNKATTLTN